VRINGQDERHPEAERAQVGVGGGHRTVDVVQALHDPGRGSMPDLVEEDTADGY